MHPFMRMPIEPERRRMVYATAYLAFAALLLIVSDMLLPDDWTWQILEKDQPLGRLLHAIRDWMGQ